MRQRFRLSSSHKQFVRHRKGRPPGWLAIILSLLYLALAGPLPILAYDWPETVTVVSVGVHDGFFYDPGNGYYLQNHDLRIADGQGPDGKGTVFYCLDYAINGVDTQPVRSDWDNILEQNEAAVQGLLALLDHGAPYANGAGDWSGSIQATRLAVWAYLGDQGLGNNPNFGRANLAAYAADPNTDPAAAEFMLSLYDLAVAARDGEQNPAESSLWTNPEAPEWQFDGQSATAKLTVEGEFSRFTLDLPEGVSAEPSEGGPGTTIQLSASALAAAQAQEIKLSSVVEGGSAAVYGWYSGSGVTQDVVGHPGNIERPGQTLTLQLPALTGTISLQKSGEDGKPLAGVTFRLKNEAGDVISEQSSDSDGRIIWKQLPLGHYQIEETAVPAPYLLNPEIIEADLTTANPEGQFVFSTTVTNLAAKAQVLLQKQCAKADKAAADKAGLSLAGAVYVLKDQAGNTVAELTTDAAGQAASPADLPLGQYTLQEQQAAAGFALDPQVYPVDLTYQDSSSKLVQVTVTSTEALLRGNLKIRKTASSSPEVSELAETGDWPLAGVSFELYPVDQPELAITVQTDEQGEAVWTDLPYGDYQLRELAPAWAETGFETVLHLPQDDQPAAWTELEIENELPLGAVQIVKTDARTKEQIPQAGVTFKIYSLDQDSYVSWQPAGENAAVEQSWTTDDSGMVILPFGLPYGNYRLEELTAPQGYHLQSEGIPFSLTAAAEGEPVVLQLDVANEPTWLQLIKTAAGSGEILPGASFVIEDTAGEAQRFIQEADGSYRWLGLNQSSDTASADRLTVSEQGELEIWQLPYGDYILREVEAPAGYQLAEAIAFTIDDQSRFGNQSKLEVTNLLQPTSTPAPTAAPTPTPTLSPEPTPTPTPTPVSPVNIPSTGENPPPWLGLGLISLGMAILLPALRFYFRRLRSRAV
ncbi:MAG: SpaA isopeptide-forming pilin-related protein [Oscillospiraceae bacterium]|nr:SpaA isopeptide-forming pilin-related protein [Oscillospiraceae bacterium]MDD4367373.1 SpaA isopeptide-forming pilin-related protein [Oscillospiraceae bacterium]